MSLTASEKERVQYHTGYGSVSPAAAITYGLPALIQPLFIVENAMKYLPPESEDRVRRTLDVLDGVECKLVDAQDRLMASRLGDLELREDETDRLEREYFRWATRLAETLRVPLYPYAQRFRRFLVSGGRSGGSIPVAG